MLFAITPAERHIAAIDAYIAAFHITALLRARYYTAPPRDAFSPFTLELRYCRYANTPAYAAAAASSPAYAALLR